MIRTPEPPPALRLDAFLPYRLSFTANLVSELVAGTYQSLFGLSSPEWRIIAVVAESRQTTQQAVRAKTRMDKVTVSRATVALVQRGFLDRVPNAQDKRSQWLALSNEGTALYDSVAPKALELERRIFAAIPPDELAAFTATLRTIDALVIADQERNSQGGGDMDARKCASNARTPGGTIAALGRTA